MRVEAWCVNCGRRAWWRKRLHQGPAGQLLTLDPGAPGWGQLQGAERGEDREVLAEGRV